MSLSRAIERTLNYAEFFGYQPSQEEIYRWLISSRRYSLDQISRLSQKVSHQPIVSTISKQKINYAQQMADRLSWFPGILMIGLTGSVAANNAKDSDDIDIFIITRNNFLWFVRPFFLFFLSFFYKRRRRGEHHNLRDVFCPNLWLDESFLTIKNRNLYTAHEVLQVLPLLNKNHIYEKFITENSWTKKYLANAYHLTTHRLPREALAKWGHPGHRSGIRALTNLLLIPLNHLFYLLQLLYMHPYKTTEKVTPHSAFLHTRDYSHLK